MRIRRVVLVLMAALVLSVAGVTAAFAAPKAQDHGQDPAPARTAVLGMGLTPLTPAATEELGLPEGLVGLLVQRVAEDGPAGRAGIQVHDVINGVVGSGAGTPAELFKALAQADPGSVLTLMVVRDGVRHEVAVHVPQRQDRPDRLDRQDRPDRQVPGWLRHTYQFANQHPHALDDVFRNVDDDGNVHVLAATNGKLVAMGVVLSDGTDAAIDASTDLANATRFIVVELLNGETKRFRLDGETVVIKAFERTQLIELDLGERVIVAERDGTVRGVVAGPYEREGRVGPRPQPQPRPNPGDGQGGSQGFRQALERTGERFERVENGLRNMNERMAKIAERFAEHVHGNAGDDQEGDAA